MFTVFTVFYAHYAEDHLPKSNGRETIHLSDLSLSGFYDELYAHDAKDYLPKSNGREKAAKWTNIAAKKYNNSSKAFNIDPTAPITSNIPPREASREPQHWAKRANMEKDMP